MCTYLHQMPNTILQTSGFFMQCVAAGKPIKEAIQDDEWLTTEFITTVQQRGSAIIKVCSSKCHMGDRNCSDLFVITIAS